MSTSSIIEITDGSYQSELSAIPESWRTYRQCFSAVVKDGLALEHVPVKHRTEAMCAAACAENGNAVRYIPPSLSDPTAVIVAGLSNFGYALHHVPEEQRTIEMCFAAVCQDREAWTWVPDAVRPLLHEWLGTSTPKEQ